MAFADTWPTEAQKAEWDAQVTPQDYVAETSNPWGLHPRFLPQRVVAKAGLVPGDIHVDAVARYLYHIEEGGTAMRYGVAIARGTSTSRVSIQSSARSGGRTGNRHRA